MFDVALLIDRLVPAAEYFGSVTGNMQAEFDALNWTDARAKPTWQNILDEDVIYQKEVLVAWLEEYRWQRETGGILSSVTRNSQPLGVDTTDRSKTLVNGAYNKVLAENTPNATMAFKVLQGWFDLLHSEIETIGLEVGDHVRKCFEAEATTTDKINDGTLTSESAIQTDFETNYAAA
jgi:hypothetical protein